MARVALLIGVSEYKQGLDPLPGAVRDVDAVKDVLVHPEMGEFRESDITVLKNSDCQEMKYAIDELFADREKGDLLLLYFSGHGISVNGQLYLCTRETRKTNNRLVNPSAVSAQFIHECINESKSRHQVIILDCCYSGAIAKGMTHVKADGTINLEQNLGGEGRAILTSSSEIELSFGTDVEHEFSGLSVYTHFLLEGIKTGAADVGNDSWIPIEKIHSYAASEVKKHNSNMTPQYLPVRDGSKILLAKSLKKSVSSCSDISASTAVDVPKPNLSDQLTSSASTIKPSPIQKLRSPARISPPQRLSSIFSTSISIETSHPRTELSKESSPSRSQTSHGEVSDLIMAIVASSFVLISLAMLIISIFKGLENMVNLGGNPGSTPTSNTKPSPVIAPSAQVTPAASVATPSPEMYYSKLEKLLESGDFKWANEETINIFTLPRNTEGHFTGNFTGYERLLKGVERVDCEKFRKVDQLWVKYSNGHFGFGVQKKIFLSTGKNRDKFFMKIGLLRYGTSVANGKIDYDVVRYINDVVGDISAPAGHLPIIWKSPVGPGGLPFNDYADALGPIFVKAEACGL
jgi:uncharacterized caspase-like protein